jgi:dTDP-4-amino-4,6-dideoxygalactose transaminase
MGLVPTEAWEFSLKDVIAGLIASIFPGPENVRLDLDGLGQGIPVRSGRAGIVIALKSLGLKKDAGVGVPLYCCPVVFKSIVEAGCKPVFIDTEPGEYCVSPVSLEAKIADIDAVIAVHMFGHMCDMPALLDIAHGKPIIEDCAQSLGSLWAGKPSGSFGNISVFSFRSGKYLSAGEGGALFSGDAGMQSLIDSIVKAMPMPGRSESCAHVIKTYVRSKLRSQPLWGPIGSRVWALYNKKTGFIAKSPIHIGRIFPADLKITSQRMAGLRLVIEKQKSNAEYYLRELALPSEMVCLERRGAFYNRFMFPIKFRSAAECAAAADYLRRRGISTSRPYMDVLEGAPRHYGYRGDCPNAEKTLARTLVIPVHYKLKKRSLVHIAGSINEAWRLICGT